MSAANARTTARGSRRKAQIIDAAARLFHRYGYRNVSMDDVALAVGVTGPAIYRHFRNKHELLLAALDEQVTATEQIAEVLAGPGPADDRLDAYFAAQAALVLEVREASLWMREQRHLSSAERATIRERVAWIRDQIREALLSLRPETSAEDAELLTWTLMSLYSRTSEYGRDMSHDEIVIALARMSWAVVGSDISAAPRQDRGVRTAIPPPDGSRRECVLESATELFYRSGYYDVSVEDIAEASHMAIATVYQLFASKADLLHAILLRGSEGTAFVITHRLAGMTDARLALETISATYRELALGPHGRLLRILADDVVYLREDALRALRRGEREHVESWTSALRVVRPELSASECLARVHSTLAVLSEVSQIRAMRERPNLSGELDTLATAILYS